MKRKDNALSWREAVSINRRALGMLFRQYPQIMLSQFINVVWDALTPYVGIYLSALVIDELAGAKDPARLGYLVILTLTSSAAIALVSAFLKKWKNTHNAARWYIVVTILVQKFLDMDYASCDDTHTSDLMNKIYQDQNGGGWGLEKVISQFNKLCGSFFTIFGGIALTVSLFSCKVPEGAGALAVLDRPWLVVAVIGVMLAVTVIAPALSNKAGIYWVKYSNVHSLGNRLYSFFGFLGYNREIAADVRMYAQDRICEKYIRNKDGTFSSNGLFAKLARGPMGLYSAASGAVTVIFTGVVYAFVCLKAWAGAFGLGSVTQYVSSVTKVSGGMSSFIAAVGDMRNNAAFLKHIFEFLDIPNNMYKGSLTVEKRRDREYDVEFRNVSFKYPGSESYALRNINMKFKVGKRLAVVGMNGSGKTTFIKLLCRLYDPTEGEILLNGIDIRKYNYAEYMNIFSVVFQDFKLFALRLDENIASGTSPDRSRVLDCLEKAGFSDRLAEMKDGAKTYLYKDYDKNGVDISGGEAQKLAIARALYKDAPFIILDEPTAALDPMAEAEIYSKFDEIAGDKTAIYISHRLSSCKFCDEIAVFHEGTVIQQGTHAALVADEGGKYYELWHAQAQYYTEEANKTEHFEN